MSFFEKFHQPEEQKNPELEIEELGKDGEEVDSDLVKELLKRAFGDGRERTSYDENVKKGVDLKRKIIDDEGISDEFQSVEQSLSTNPWLNPFIKMSPSDYQSSKLEGKMADAHLELEFIHGYRCHDTRNNLRYTNKGDIVYHTAAVGIVYNKEKNTQKFFNEHFDDITALAIHPNKKIIATGEVGPNPLITVWDTETCEIISKIKEPLKKGINHLAFSRDGKYLAAVAADDNHRMAVFDWRQAQVDDELGNIENPRKRIRNRRITNSALLAYVDTGRESVCGASFNKGGDQVALACVKKILILTIINGRIIIKKVDGIRGKKVTTFLSCAYFDDYLLCGSMQGDLLIIQGCHLRKTIKAHNGSINSIFIKDGENGFITGGADGQIITWDKNFNMTSKISIAEESLGSLCPKVRSIDEDIDGNLLIGTRGGEIIEIVHGIPKILLRGHWDNEVWGLCVNPKEDIYYTTGEDKLLAAWDAKENKIKANVKIEDPGTCMDISSDGKYLAIGCVNGNWYIYDPNTLSKIYESKGGEIKEINEVKFSPDCKFLAIGGIDTEKKEPSKIYLYEVENNYQLKNTLEGHNSAITHIDWDEKSEYIQSTSNGMELKYHTVNGEKIEDLEKMKDIKWNTFNCPIGVRNILILIFLIVAYGWYLA
ncbi:MAG: hypothetical protein MJ252_05855 [archaeon]|nr:hypothetical protein [archaeon]